MRLNEVIGQEEVRKRLESLIAERRVPHALLFCGPQGCGKMATALAFASTLLTPADAAPDFKARQEAMLAKWQHPDLHFTYPTIKLPGMSSDHQPVSSDFSREWHSLLAQGPYFSIDQWMNAMGAANQQAVITGAESDELARKLSLKSSQGGYKVSIIWLPERMNQTSANKLLKLLEEPPSQTVFIMVTQEPGQLLETIRSRTQRIDLRRIDEATIEQALTTQRGIDPDMAHRVARVANGSWLKALDELDAGNENRLFLDLFIMLMRLAYMRNVHDLRKWSENAAALGREKQRRMLTYFMRLVRENFVFNFRQKELCYMSEEEEQFATRFARFINEANVIEINDLLQLAHRDIGQNANPKVVFFDLALRMIVLLIQK